VNTSKTSTANQIKILDEAFDGENYWNWEQSIDIEAVDACTGGGDEDAIQEWWVEFLELSGVEDEGYSSYVEVRAEYDRLARVRSGYPEPK
jgi:hypothetical protein